WGGGRAGSGETGRAVAVADDEPVALEGRERAFAARSPDRRLLAGQQRRDDAAARPAVGGLERGRRRTAARRVGVAAAAAHGRALAAARRAGAADGRAELHHRLVEGRGAAAREQHGGTG